LVSRVEDTGDQVSKRKSLTAKVVNLMSIKKIVQIIIGSLLIITGIGMGSMGFISVDLRGDLIAILFQTAPTMIAAVGFVFVGILIIYGTTWREVMEFITHSMWP